MSMDKSIISDANLKKLEDLKNPHMLKVVEDFITHLKPAKVTVSRDGRSIELGMTLSSAEASPRQQRDHGTGDQSGQGDLLGLVVDDAEQGGVVVFDVVRGSAAADAGIRRGDVIVSVNRKKVSNRGEYQRSIQQVGRGGSLTVLVRRGDASIYFALRIK